MVTAMFRSSVATANLIGDLRCVFGSFKPWNGGTLVTTEESMEGWLISILKPLMPGFLDKQLDVWAKDVKSKAER